MNSQRSSLNLKFLECDETHHIGSIFLGPFPSPLWVQGTRGNHTNMSHVAFCTVGNRALCLIPGALFSLPTSMKLQQATLLDCKQNTFSGPSVLEDPFKINPSLQTRSLIQRPSCKKIKTLENFPSTDYPEKNLVNQLQVWLKHLKHQNTENSYDQATSFY